MFRYFVPLVALVVITTMTPTLLAQRTEEMKIREHVEKLLLEVERLEDAGEIDKARQLAAKAREMVREADRFEERDEQHADSREFDKRADAMRAEIKELVKRGRIEEAERLERQVHQIIRQAEEHAHAEHHERGHASDFERRIDHLHAAVENLMAAGMKREAEAIQERIEEMHREREHHHHGEHANAEVAELHERVGHLTEHVERLTHRVEQLTEFIEKMKRELD